jgi:hypothetical protein
MGGVFILHYIVLSSLGFWCFLPFKVSDHTMLPC